MRNFYLLIILSLILFMSWEFERFGSEYDALSTEAEHMVLNVKYMEKHCTCPHP
jgi:flagellar biogenesis protein FliO